MATATLTLYRTGGISKLVTVDYISEYLNTISNSSKLVISNADHFEHSYKPTKLKIALDQFRADQWSSSYDYLSVKNSDEGQTFYYFLSNPTVDAKRTISYDLEMDVISTWLYLFKANFKDTTRIIRQHEDRFVNLFDFTWYPLEDYSVPEHVISYAIHTFNPELTRLTPYQQYNATIEYTIEPAAAQTYVIITPEFDWEEGDLDFIVKNNYSEPVEITAKMYIPVPTGIMQHWPIVVNEVGEGLGSLPKMKSSKSVIKDNNSDLKWYLILKSHGNEDNNPLDIYLCADQQIYLRVPGTGEITYRDIEPGKYYYFTYRENLGASFTLPTIGTHSLGESISPYFYGTLMVSRGSGSGTLEFRLLAYHQDTGVYNSTNSKYGSGTNWSTRGLKLAYVSDTNNILDIDMIRALTATYTLSGIQTLYPISEWDQADPQLINIIECPYCPIPYTISDSVYTFGNEWVFDGSSRLHCSTNIPTLSHLLTNNDLFDFTRNLPEINVRRANRSYSDYYEPKLMHSDYFTDKFTYDSFAIEIPYERLSFHDDDGESSLTNNYQLKATYQQSPISSDLQFKITFGDNLNFKEMADFETVLASNRNNLYPIFTDAYLNYMNVGYNYDRKSATHSEISSAISMAGGIANFVGGIVGAAGSQRGIGIAYGVSATTSGLTSMSSGILNVLQTEDNLAKKQEELRQQSATISGSNDLTLFSLNTNNKAIRYQYSVSDELKDELTALFHYYGYAKNRKGIPNFNSRCRFNYVQCEPQFKESIESNGVLTKYLPYIKQRFAEGITFVHLYNNSYDLNCQYENWETWLV